MLQCRRFYVSAPRRRSASERCLRKDHGCEDSCFSGQPGAQTRILISLWHEKIQGQGGGKALEALRSDQARKHRTSTPDWGSTSAKPIGRSAGDESASISSLLPSKESSISCRRQHQGMLCVVRPISFSWSVHLVVTIPCHSRQKFRMDIKVSTVLFWATTAHERETLVKPSKSRCAVSSHQRCTPRQRWNHPKDAQP